MELVSIWAAPVRRTGRRHKKATGDAAQTGLSYVDLIAVRHPA